VQRNLISVATCVHGATRIDERTLAHENIRKQGKFPNTAEISLEIENVRAALDDHFFPFPSEKKIRIWRIIVRACAKTF
jgi:hypothetical protein